MVSAKVSCHITRHPYLGIKAVRYCVSWLGLDFLGLKLEFTALPDGHFMVCCLGRRRKGERE